MTDLIISEFDDAVIDKLEAMAQSQAKSVDQFTNDLLKHIAMQPSELSMAARISNWLEEFRVSSVP